MKEIDNPIVDMPTVRRDLYFVMSLLLADKAVVKVPDVVVWTEVFHENEVGRLMLWVAAAMRGLLDLLDKGNKFNAKICGEYWAYFPSGEERPLTFRRACNAVIHAKEIFPYKVPQYESRKTDKQVYTDRITVRGIYRGRTTRAYLDIVKFVQIADTLINLYQEKDNASN